MKKLWKSMKAGMLSGSGDIGSWKLNEWRVHDKPLVMCESGFHASENVVDAMGYVNAEVIAEVEVRGEHLERNDKQVWEEMRILRAWEWTKEDSVSLAIYAAELVIGVYEKKHPDDNRPRRAIDAAKAWLKDPSEKNRNYAASASASAAYAYAYAAYAAADAAADAAYVAADAAYVAYAKKGTLDKVEKWIQKRIKGLREA